jgi:phenylacetate-CoA ligase
MNPYNLFLEQLALPLGDFLLRSRFISTLKRIRHEVQLDEEQIKRLQQQRLKETLDYASRYSQYYRKLDVLPDEDPQVWLKRFPILDKLLLNNHNESILTQSKAKLIKNASSGSSGLQTVGYYSQSELDYFRAIQTVFWEWGGYKLGQPIIQTGMGLNRGKVKRFKDLLLRTKYTLAFNPNKGQIVELFKQVPDNTYSFLGYASSLYVYAQIAKESELKGPMFKSAICWGDKLFDHYRQAVKEQFKCDVFETYGAAEGFQMAGQKDLKYMYLMSPYVFMEILDDQGNEVPDGQLGHVVVTNLLTRAMPMIRYRIGDLAVKLKRDDYPKVRDLSLPLLERVVGRDTDIVLTPKGGRLIVHTFTGVFEYYSGIQQFRIVQHELESFIVEYILSNDFYPDLLAKISKHLEQVIQDDSISWTYSEVGSIPDTPSGKPQIIKSHLPKASL